MDFKAFTVLDKEDENGNFIKLIESARKWGWPLEAFFHRADDGYREFLCMKHTYVLDALNKLKVERFLFLDAWDTRFIGPPDPMLLDSPYLWFGAEKNCYPDEVYKALYPSLGYPFTYINTGVIWGNAHTFRKLCPGYRVDDQRGWQRVYALHPEEIHLDNTAKVAINLYGVEEGDFSRMAGGRIIYRPTETSPLVMHANGTTHIPAWV